MSSKNKGDVKKQSDIVQQIKESQTLDKKHKEMVNLFNNNKIKKENIEKEIEEIKTKLIDLPNHYENTNINYIKKRAELINTRNEKEIDKNNLQDGYDEMDYYDKTGDLIIQYYELRDCEVETKQTKNILFFLGNKKEEPEKNINEVNRADLFNKYWQRIEGIRINMDDGSKRIKYCKECNFEKIFDYSVSAFVCQVCGIVEEIILDEDRQIKDYSPYKRINHFKEWLNQFQARQSPDIPEEVFKEIITELNKNRIVDLKILNRKKMKKILKKLNYNSYYEHVHYIINKLTNLPPPKITRDMEKIFIKMFIKIESIWQIYKPTNRKNFLSYPYVLYKFCELLELDHLLPCFQLHKDDDKLMEDDELWKKMCKHLNWEFISSI
jgi:hypothetical protein